MHSRWSALLADALLSWLRRLRLRDETLNIAPLISLGKNFPTSLSIQERNSKKCFATPVLNREPLPAFKSGESYYVRSSYTKTRMKMCGSIGFF